MFFILGITAMRRGNNKATINPDSTIKSMPAKIGDLPNGQGIEKLKDAAR
jgi:hypothetical protein